MGILTVGKFILNDSGDKIFDSLIKIETLSEGTTIGEAINHIYSNYNQKFAEDPIEIWIDDFVPMPGRAESRVNSALSEGITFNNFGPSGWWLDVTHHDPRHSEYDESEKLKIFDRSTVGRVSLGFVYSREEKTPLITPIPATLRRTEGGGQNLNRKYKKRKSKKKKSKKKKSKKKKSKTHRRRR